MWITNSVQYKFNFGHKTTSWNYNNVYYMVSGQLSIWLLHKLLRSTRNWRINLSPKLSSVESFRDEVTIVKIRCEWDSISTWNLYSKNKFSLVWYVGCHLSWNVKLKLNSFFMNWKHCIKSKRKKKPCIHCLSVNSYCSCRVIKGHILPELLKKRLLQNSIFFAKSLLPWHWTT